MEILEWEAWTKDEEVSPLQTNEGDVSVVWHRLVFITEVTATS